MIVIGVIGEKGSGKETFGTLLAEILPDKKVVGIATSNILKQTLALWNLADIRENYTKLVVSMEQIFGAGSLAKANRKLIEGSDAQIVVVDGLRRYPEIDLIRSFPQNYLVYLTASPQVRFERIKNRRERENETAMSFDLFLQEENLETEQLIKEMAKGADYTIENNEGLEEFKSGIEKFTRRFTPLD